MFSYHLAVDGYRYHTCTAHAGCIYHYRVKACYCFNTIRFGEIADCAHHQRWTDGNDFTNGTATIVLHLIQHLFKWAGDKVFDAKAAVIGGIDHIKQVWILSL